jgi:hypothetical protein
VKIDLDQWEKDAEDHEIVSHGGCEDRILELIERVRELEKDNDVLRDLYHGCNKERAFQEKDRWKCKKRIAKLEEGLKYYSHEGDFTYAPDVAREALKEDE